MLINYEIRRRRAQKAFEQNRSVALMDAAYERAEKTVSRTLKEALG